MTTPKGTTLKAILPAAEKLFLGKSDGDVAIRFDILTMSVIVLLLLAGMGAGFGFYVPGMAAAGYGFGIAALLVAAYAMLGGLTLLARRRFRAGTPAAA